MACSSETKTADKISALIRVESRAGGEGGMGGFKKELLVENLSERDEKFLLCSQCRGILREACTVVTGEQSCSECIRKGETSLPNLQVRSTVMELTCRCPLSQRGCEWSGELQECESHLNTCCHLLMTCELGCGEVMARNLMEQHMSGACSLRKSKCEHCGVECKVSEVNEHFGVCAGAVVECELGCGQSVRRDQMETHQREECDQQIVQCPFEKYGCGLGEVSRKSLRVHMTENREQHTDLRLREFEGVIDRQNKQIEYLTKKIVALENQNNMLARRLDKSETLVWEISQLLPKLNSETSGIILKLPTSSQLQVCGYMVKFGWWVEGSSLSIDLYMMVGENDRELLWPFRCSAVTRFVSDKDAASRSVEVQKLGAEVDRKMPTKLAPSSVRIASVNKCVLQARGFMRGDSLRVEITLKSLNPF